MGSTVETAVVGLLEKEIERTWPWLSLAQLFFSRMGRYGELLASWGSRFSLVSRPTDPEAVVFHIVDCLAPLGFELQGSSPRPYFEAGGRIADIGSGAGFPGVVLASACDAHFVLFEPRRKRAGFLRIVVVELGLKNVRVEERKLPFSESESEGCFDLALGRAVGPVADFFTLSASILKPSAHAIFYASARQAREINLTQNEAFRIHGIKRYAVKSGWAREQERRGNGIAPVLRERALVYFERIEREEKLLADG